MQTVESVPTLTAPETGYIGEFFVDEEEYVEVGTPLIEIEIKEDEEG